jgi:hypothetical protein
MTNFYLHFIIKEFKLVIRYQIFLMFKKFSIIIILIFCDGNLLALGYRMTKITKIQLTI